MRGAGGRHRRRCSPDAVELISLVAREGTWEWRGEELKCRTICLRESEVGCWHVRWVGSKGSVRVPGTMVGTGYGKGVYWSSKAVSVMLGP